MDILPFSSGTITAIDLGPARTVARDIRLGRTPAFLDTIVPDKLELTMVYIALLVTRCMPQDYGKLHF